LLKNKKDCADLNCVTLIDKELRFFHTDRTRV